MKIELLTYWKAATESGEEVNTPAISDSSNIELWQDITAESSATFYTGDNLVILRCEVTQSELTALQASSDCYVMRIDGIPQNRSDLATWLTSRGVDVAKYAQANFTTDADISDTITQYKSEK